MIKIIATYIIILQVFLLNAQQKESRTSDMITNKFVQLYKDKLIDSLTLSLHFYKNYYHEPNTRLFRIYTDTLFENDSMYSVGKITIDDNVAFDGIRIGTWSTFYLNGKLFSKGKYKVGIITNCQVMGPTMSAYSFKSGKWVYYYKNGTKMAEGVFGKIYAKFKNSCSEDAFIIPVTTQDWIFYNETNKRIKVNKSISDKINGG